MKQKSESVFNMFKKHPEPAEEPIFDNTLSEKKHFIQVIDDEVLFLTTPALYEDYLSGGTFHTCFKKFRETEPISGTHYYKDCRSDAVYTVKAVIRNGEFDAPEDIFILPSHALSSPDTCFIGVIGKANAGKTTLMAEITTIGEKLLCYYSPMAQCQIDVDYPVASQPYAEMKDRKKDFLKGMLPLPTVPSENTNAAIYPLCIRSENGEGLFVFQDFSGEALSAGIVPPAEFKDFLFVIDAEDIIKGLKDPFYPSGNEEILSNIFSFIPTHQMKEVFIQIVIAKSDLLRQYADAIDQEDQSDKTQEQLEKENLAKEYIQTITAPIPFDSFSDSIQAHDLACRDLIKLADPVLINRLELNLVTDGSRRYCFNGISALGKNAEPFETENADRTAGTFDVLNLKPVNVAAFLYSFLQTFGIFQYIHETKSYFEEDAHEEIFLTDVDVIDQLQQLTDEPNQTADNLMA